MGRVLRAKARVSPRSLDGAQNLLPLPATMHDYLKKKLLSQLLSKPAPERYSISAPIKEQKHYDWISVHGTTKAHSDVMLISFDQESNIIEYLWWESDTSNSTSQNTQCQFDDLLWDSLRATHRYITWDVTYSSLIEAYIYDILRLQKIKWIIQRIRDRFIQPIKPNYQIRLLEYLVQLHNAGKSITLNELLVKVYGSAVRLSNDQYRFYKELEFLVDSLVDSGHAIRKTPDNHTDFLEGGDVKPTPKAITTLANAEIDRVRHRDTVWLTRCQLFLGLAMLAVAAVTLFVELLGE